MEFRTYKYRLYPTKDQKEKIDKLISVCEDMNGLILEAKAKNPGRNFTQKEMLDYLIENIEECKTSCYSALRNELEYCEKSKVRVYRPSHSFKVTYSYVMAQKYPILDGVVYIPKIGWIRKTKNRGLKADKKIDSYFVSRTRERKYELLINVSFSVPETEHSSGNAMLSLDYSSAHFAVDDSGNKYDIPHFYRDMQKRISEKKKKQARCKPGSSRYRELSREIRTEYHRISRRRLDWMHKLSTKLADEYDCIAVENLNLVDICANYHLGKATMDNSYAIFIKMLDYKLRERGKKLIRVSRWFPSSKTCSICGYINNDLSLGERTWICPHCGRSLDRDRNAAINIRNEALRMLGSIGGQPMR